jgi:hypothetical protein
MTCSVPNGSRAQPAACKAGWMVEDREAVVVLFGELFLFREALNLGF